MNNGEQQARMWPWIRLTEQQAATCGLMANSGDHRTDDLRASRRARINNAIDRADELIAAVRTVRAIERMPT